MRLRNMEVLVYSLRHLPASDELFSSGDTYASLCVIGPAAETISHQFLVPLESNVACRHHFLKHVKKVQGG